MKGDARGQDNPRFAGFISRLTAFVIDVLIILAAAAMAGIVANLLVEFFNNAIIETPLAQDPVKQGAGASAAMIWQLAYFVFFWSVLGKTPGMALMGLDIARADGGRVGVLRGIVRYFGYWISAALFFLGFLWILVDRRRRGWHDMLAGTVIVYSSSSRAYHAQVEAIRRRTAQVDLAHPQK